MALPSNVIVRRVLITDLSQQLKKQRDFLRWMARRYSSSNPDQAAAFTTGAQLFNTIREELVQGMFDAGEEDLFTGQAAGSSPADFPGSLSGYINRRIAE